MSLPSSEGYPGTTLLSFSPEGSGPTSGLLVPAARHQHVEDSRRPVTDGSAKCTRPSWRAPGAPVRGQHGAGRIRGLLSKGAAVASPCMLGDTPLPVTTMAAWWGGKWHRQTGGARERHFIACEDTSPATSGIFFFLTYKNKLQIKISETAPSLGLSQHVFQSPSSCILCPGHAISVNRG